MTSTEKLLGAIIGLHVLEENSRLREENERLRQKCGETSDYTPSIQSWNTYDQNATSAKPSGFLHWDSSWSMGIAVAIVACAGMGVEHDVGIPLLLAALVSVPLLFQPSVRKKFGCLLAVLFTLLVGVFCWLFDFVASIAV